MGQQKLQPLGIEIARRMYAVGSSLPADSDDAVRVKYEAMAAESRMVMTERLRRYVQSLSTLCVKKGHVGSTPPGKDGTGGAPCPQCRRQIRSMRTMLKIVDPTPDE